MPNTEKIIFGVNPDKGKKYRARPTSRWKRLHAGILGNELEQGPDYQFPSEASSTPPDDSTVEVYSWVQKSNPND